MTDPGEQVGCTFVEVSDDMRKAGLEALHEMPFTTDLSELVGAVYMAMEYERLDSLNKLGRLFDQLDLPRR